MAWRAWLQTKQGRQVLQGVAVAAGFTGFSAYYLPNTVFLNNYKDFVQSYSKGIHTPVAPKVIQLYEQVLTDLKVSDFEKSMIEIFTVYGFDLFHAGSSTLRSGAIVGVPVNFSYETENDVDRRIQVVTKSVDWESTPGEKLRASLVLSDDARKFGLAREVIAVRGHSIWFQCIYPLAAVVLTYMSSVALNEKLRLRQHPFRFIMYGLLAAFNGAVYCTATDVTNVTVEAACDREAASLGLPYARGGVEFYTKLRERNKALRELMGDAGAKLYTTSGNDVVLVRIRTTPLSERLLAAEQLLAEIYPESSNAP